MKFNYCPKCGSEDINQKTHNLFICNKCGFNIYVNPTPTTAAIIENPQGEILLVKRKFDPMKGYWDLPGGFVEPDESLEEGTVREIKEELGVEISDIEYLISCPDEYLFQEVNYKILGIVLTGKVTDVEKITPSDDVEEAVFFKKDELPLARIAFKNIKQGLIDYLKK